MKLTILGCGSATPTLRHLPSSQILEHKGVLYMIDCGEAVQISMRRYKFNFQKLVHIFISHLHGDHCFGLPGIISSFGLHGRTAPLFIHGPEGIEQFVRPILDNFCKGMSYEVKIITHKTDEHSIIFENRNLEVSTLPLQHRIPCAGFLFREKGCKPHLRGDLADFYGIPLKMRPQILAGADYESDQHGVIPNSRLTIPAEMPETYAYCSDTAFQPSLIPYIKDIDLLYHETTFMENERQRATATFHSCTTDAAKIALKANVKHLLVGHYSARYNNDQALADEAKQIFPQTIAAYEGLQIDIKKLRKRS
ncbi:ribonuclease Z [Falsiporphyromonas endometrii]|uniref:Ribonuclease Z n=1 Tax=Falsiporphyromonas endometrii TaxID=1387297 RepID=A0ABV9K895_9PORP